MVSSEIDPEFFPTTITPNLSVRNGTLAVEFYKAAFGATELWRMASPDGPIVAEMSIGGARFLLADESPEHANFSPESLGGSSVRIDLFVADPDNFQARAIAAGAKEAFAVADQDFGYQMGRVMDPFGHHWMIGRPLGARRLEQE